MENHGTGGADSTRREFEEKAGMEDGNIVLCGASSYTQKYFLNPLFAKLPQGVQDDLKIMCVTFTAQIGGTILLEFTPEGKSCFRHWKCSTASLFSGNLLRMTAGRTEKTSENRKYRVAE